VYKYCSNFNLKKTYRVRKKPTKEFVRKKQKKIKDSNPSDLDAQLVLKSIGVETSHDATKESIMHHIRRNIIINVCREAPI
jgi:hypothetical protein